MNVGFGAVNAQGQPAITDINAIRGVENLFIDNWESYPTERNSIMDTMKNRGIKNTIFLTGDSHASWSFDLTKKPAIYPNPLAANLPTPSSTYTQATGAGSVGVEFATPSITSANFDEAIGKAQTGQFEYLINNPVPVGPPFGSVVYNPHLKYVDLDRHGYFILDLKDDSAQADYYYVDTLRISTNKETFGKGVVTANNSNRITRLSSKNAVGKAVQQGQAPTKPMANSSSIKNNLENNAIIIGVFPIPTDNLLHINYALNKSGLTDIAIYNSEGEFIKTVKIGFQNAGIYTYSLDVSKLIDGIYFFQLIVDGQMVTSGKYIKN